MGMTYFSLSAGEITIAYDGPTNPASPGSVDPTLPWLLSRRNRRGEVVGGGLRGEERTNGGARRGWVGGDGERDWARRGRGRGGRHGKENQVPLRQGR